MNCIQCEHYPAMVGLHVRRRFLPQQVLCTLASEVIVVLANVYLISMIGFFLFLKGNPSAVDCDGLYLSCPSIPCNLMQITPLPQSSND